ncbi:MAG: FHA domain-containing protein [Gammaproteobacteria bacterium]|nr:FHA domain-containing protein [Gammaproteobacteria bacterium]MBT8110326.1 FHA domain-containing protein [Gammaproteobacteria bacterium]NND47673.1 FHA domain-containing protein [Woeseiaceae bacterium]NNL45029.1 FHA domain-containing protein [Woeseiaceae bacterium]
MARALENPDAIPAYLDFFGMKRPPFAKLSVPSQLFHSDQYSVLADHLASATEQSDFLLVLCGTEGSGKTTLLNRHILQLDEDVSYATFDESCADGTQFYCGLLRQLGFHDISGKLNELSNIAREFLIHRGMAGDPVLLVVDNAHLVCASVLEQLRSISETVANDRRVLSVVLAGNSDLLRIMRSPAMRKLNFQRHVEFNIRVYSEQETEDYVRHRLRLSGGADAAKIGHEAHPVIYRFTGGIPDLINRLLNAVLTEACSLQTRVVTGDLIRGVAEACEILPHVVPLQAMGRRKTDSSVSLVAPVQQTEERIIARDPPPGSAFGSAAQDSALADLDIKELLNQVSQLSGQLAVQTQKTETLSSTVLDDTAEINRLEGALTETRQALRQSATAADELTARADAEIEALELEKSALQASVESLTAELETANKQAARIDALEKSLKESEDKYDSLRTSVAETQKELRAAKRSKNAADKAETKTRTRVEKLEREKSALQVSVEGLTAELETANKQAARIDALEKSLKQSKDKYDSLRASVAETKKELRAAKRSKNAADKAKTKTRTRVEKLEREKLELQKQCDSLQERTEALQGLEEAVTKKDAYIAELEAELYTYVNAEKTSPPEPADESADLPSARSDPSIEPTIGDIAVIEVFRDGKIDQVMNLAEVPSRVMIGRGDDCELCLDSKFVSRHHALIFCTDGGVCIEDLNSFNGTIVNSRKVSRCDLRADDTVTIGDFQLRPRPAVKNDPV